MMLILEQLAEILIRISTHQTIESFVERGINAATLMPLRPTTAHYKSLQRKLTNMPFIYRDLKLDIRSDFVNVDRTTLDHDSLGATPPQPVDIGTDERIKRRMRALFLGNAGMGKTTLIRHTILTLIDNGGLSRLFEAREKVVPFYVPLKAIDNTRDHPVTRYLLDNNPYLSGRNGLSRLIDLAKSQRLFLLLDGYDEVPNPSGEPISRSPFFTELGFIHHNQHKPAYAPSVGGQYAGFYQAAAGARIWMSSRFDYYRMNRVPLFERSSPTNGGPQSVVAVGLTGMGPNRPQLIKNIFDKYRSTNDKYDELLNEEVFLQKLDSSSDEELSDLSYNPLFLTIMCYIYVKEVMDPLDHGKTWTASVPLLISQCIRLLIRDLDDDKARELPARQKEGMRLRRGRYKQEMESFLPYFASELIADAKAVFDVDYIRDKLRHFVTHESDSPNSAQILKSLDSGLPSADLARQLIWCGVFIAVDTVPVSTYDFPHRRFREVLVTRYYTEHPDLLRTCVDAGQFELMYVLYLVADLRSMILAELLRRTVASADIRFGSAIVTCINKVPKDVRYKTILAKFIDECVQDNVLFFWPKELFKAIRDYGDIVPRLQSALSQALQANKRNSVELCLAVLEGLDSSFANTLRKLLNNYPALGEGRIIVLRECLVRGYFDESAAAAIMSDVHASIELCCALASDLLSDQIAARQFQLVMPRMSPYQFALFWSGVSRGRAALAASISNGKGLTSDLFGVSRLVEYYCRNGANKLASGCYVIRAEVAEKIGSRDVRKKVSGLVGRIFFADSELSQSLEGATDADIAMVLSRSYIGPAICDLIWTAVGFKGIEVPKPKQIFVDSARGAETVAAGA